jgi:hypothetical protein
MSRVHIFLTILAYFFGSGLLLCCWFPVFRPFQLPANPACVSFGLCLDAQANKPMIQM